MSFTGKYELVDSDKFDDYLKAIGVGLVTRKMANSTKPSVEITDNGDTVTIKTVSALKTTENTFIIGQEVDEQAADGRKCKTTTVRDGNSLIQTQKLDEYTSTITRTLTPTGLTATFEAGGVKSVRNYKKA